MLKRSSAKVEAVMSTNLIATMKFPSAAMHRPLPPPDYIHDILGLRVLSFGTSPLEVASTSTTRLPSGHWPTRLDFGQP
jgi:hypothetical protein